MQSHCESTIKLGSPSNLKNKGDNKHLVRVWNVTLKSGGKIKVATIEQGKRVPLNCKGCSAPCCDHFSPVLTAEEFLSKKFPTTFTRPEQWFKKQVSRAEYIATLPWKEKRCPFFDKEKHSCLLWATSSPQACLAYDCREDPRPQIQEFVKKHIKEINGEIEWQGQ